MHFPIIRLNEIEPNRKYTVVEIEAEPIMKNRLRELGVIRGTETELMIKSGSGSIASYLVRGVQIAFRRETAEHILVTESEHCLKTDEKGDHNE